MTARLRRALLVLPAAIVFSGILRGSAALGENLPVVTGIAAVVDASHVDVAGQRLKLYGIDAPDSDETCQDAKGAEYACGIEARDALLKLVSSGSVSCLSRGPNELNEMLATCTVGQIDVARALVEAGWAIADRTRTLYYEDTELAARTAKRGLWQGPFVAPDAWRIGERVPQNRRGISIPEATP